jgi:hypothetical protein
VIARIANCFEVGEKEDVPLIKFKFIMQHICISMFCNGRGHRLWWICSMETDYCYSLHYLRFQKTPTICSQDPFRIYYHL